jgi:hypothetical protein
MVSLKVCTGRIEVSKSTQKQTLTPTPSPRGRGGPEVEQGIEVEAWMEDGQVKPTNVVWQGRRVAVTDVGRQWTQDDGGIAQRHVLVMLPNSDRLELALNPQTLTWRLVQAWTTPTVG